MSLSKEYQEYHLTTKGWITGSFKGDVFGGSHKVPNPVDRVLTIMCCDELTSAFAKPIYHDEVIWQSDDKQLINKLKAKWGEQPDWFGYEKMKED